MSGVDTESESDQEAVIEDEEPETPYVPLTEEEFGSVSSWFKCSIVLMF